MPRKARGSVYKTKGGVGIRWVESGKRQHRSGFRNKTEAHDWWDREIAPRLKRGGPSPQITFDEFCIEFLRRYESGHAARTVQTMRERLVPARAQFGDWKLAELEGAANDVSRWRDGLGSEHARYRHTRALRQVLAAAVRWGYISRNSAVDFGQNAQPHPKDIDPPTREEVDLIVAEMHVQDAAMVMFAAETGLRTNELLALERRDVDQGRQEVVVSRRFSRGVLHQFPKAERRRRVPLTPRAQQALAMVPARLDTPLLFPAPQGGCWDLDHWRRLRWAPALRAAGVRHRNPYSLRHAFATNALRAGVSVFELSRLMGTGVKQIDQTYGHLAHDSSDHLRLLLSQGSGGFMASEGEA